MALSDALPTTSNQSPFPRNNAYSWCARRSLWPRLDDSSRPLGHVRNQGRTLRSFLSVFHSNHLDCNASGGSPSSHGPACATFWNLSLEAFVPPNLTPVRTSGPVE